MLVPVIDTYVWIYRPNENRIDAAVTLLKAAKKAYANSARIWFALGVAWVVLCAITTEVALGLAFDPRYRDFPFAPLGAGAAPFVILALLGAGGGRRELAEIAMAAVLAAATLYIAWNEGPANWQSLCLCAVFAVLILTLLRSWAAPSSE